MFDTTRLLVLGVAAVGLSILVSGYELDDLLIYLPLTLYLRDSSLFPGNPLIQQLLTMPYPAYRAYALAYDPRLLFVVFVVSRCALIGGLWVLGRQLLTDSLTVVLGLAFLVFTPGWFGTLGGTSLLQSEPSQFDLATPFCILALAAALGARYSLAFGLAGLGFNLQPILGGVTMMLLGLELVFNKVVRARQIRIASATQSIAIGVGLATPALISTLTGLGSRLYEQPPDYLGIVKFTAFYQIFPSTFSPFEYASSGLVGLGAIMAVRTGVAERHQFVLALWFGAILTLCAIGTVFSEFLPIGLVLKLMPFRATLHFKVLGLLLCAGLTSRMFKGYWSRPFATLTLSGAALVVGLAVARPIHIGGISPSSELERAAAWARTHTTKDAVFATPPDSSIAGFTLYSERSTLGDYKLDTQAVWDPTFAHEAYIRLNALGCDGPWNPWCVKNRYEAFSAEDFHRLRDQFGACYALTRRQQVVDQPILYESASYRIYALCPGLRA